METIIYLIRHAKKLSGRINSYDAKESMQIRNEKQILSIEGEEQAASLAKNPLLGNVEAIYSSHYVRALGTAKYLAKELNLMINVDERLGERIPGEVDYKKREVFEYNQHHDFDYKVSEGESINDAKKRVTDVFAQIIDMHMGKEIAVFSHATVTMAFLLKYCEVEYNLDDRLILVFNGENIDSMLHESEFFRLTFKDKKLINIEKFEK